MHGHQGLFDGVLFTGKTDAGIGEGLEGLGKCAVVKGSLRAAPNENLHGRINDLAKRGRALLSLAPLVVRQKNMQSGFCIEFQFPPQIAPALYS